MSFGAATAKKKYNNEKREGGGGAVKIRMPASALLEKK